jgi:hypothetical protein
VASRWLQLVSNASALYLSIGLLMHENWTHNVYYHTTKAIWIESQIQVYFIKTQDEACPESFEEAMC